MNHSSKGCKSSWYSLWYQCTSGRFCRSFLLPAAFAQLITGIAHPGAWGSRITWPGGLITWPGRDLARQMSWSVPRINLCASTSLQSGSPATIWSCDPDKILIFAWGRGELSARLKVKVFPRVWEFKSTLIALHWSSRSFCSRSGLFDWLIWSSRPIK